MGFKDKSKGITCNEVLLFFFYYMNQVWDDFHSSSMLSLLTMDGL